MASIKTETTTEIVNLNEKSIRSRKAKSKGRAPTVVDRSVSDLKEQAYYRALKPICPKCFDTSEVRFLLFNNARTCKSLQIKYRCRKCQQTLTLNRADIKKTSNHRKRDQLTDNPQLLADDDNGDQINTVIDPKPIQSNTDIPTERLIEYIHRDNNLIQLPIDHLGSGIGTMNQQFNDLINANYMLNQNQDVNNHESSNLIKANYMLNQNQEGNTNHDGSNLINVNYTINPDQDRINIHGDENQQNQPGNLGLMALLPRSRHKWLSQTDQCMNINNAELINLSSFNQRLIMAQKSLLQYSPALNHLQLQDQQKPNRVISPNCLDGNPISFSQQKQRLIRNPDESAQLNQLNNQQNLQINTAGLSQMYQNNFRTGRPMGTLGMNDYHVINAQQQGQSTPMQPNNGAAYINQLQQNSLTMDYTNHCQNFAPGAPNQEQSETKLNLLSDFSNCAGRDHIVQDNYPLQFCNPSDSIDSTPHNDENIKIKAQ